MPYKDKIEAKKGRRRFYLNHTEQVKSEVRQRKKNIRDWFIEYRKTLKCANCSESDSICLDFHHKDPEEKENTISHAVLKGWGKDRILAEIEKCEVLCANCHRKRHRGLLL